MTLLAYWSAVILAGLSGLALGVAVGFERQSWHKAWAKDTVFIDHIHRHLGPGQVVVCKICGKTAVKILKEEG